MLTRRALQGGRNVECILQAVQGSSSTVTAPPRSPHAPVLARSRPRACDTSCSGTGSRSSSGPRSAFIVALRPKRRTPADIIGHRRSLPISHTRHSARGASAPRHPGARAPSQPLLHQRPFSVGAFLAGIQAQKGGPCCARLPRANVLRGCCWSVLRRRTAFVPGGGRAWSARATRRWRHSSHWRPVARRTVGYGSWWRWL